MLLRRPSLRRCCVSDSPTGKSSHNRKSSPPLDQKSEEVTVTLFGLRLRCLCQKKVAVRFCGCDLCFYLRSQFHRKGKKKKS
ncbi:hypothetical protein L1887_37840 [Cichorium endivia]|nr:hypothetical protein L1887_37840 [Cichorium endivia]